VAIAKICKLNLVALAYDKDLILNALERTKAVEVKTHRTSEYASVAVDEGEELREYLTSLESALALLCAEVEAYEKENSIKSDVLKDGFEVGYSEFMGAAEKKAEVETLVKEINRLIDEKNELKATLQKDVRAKENLSVYSLLKTPFSAFADTRSVRIRLGLIAENYYSLLEEGFQNIELANYELLQTGEKEHLVCVIYHKSVAKEAEEVLSSLGFTESVYKGEETGEKKYSEAKEKVLETEEKLRQNAQALYALREKIHLLKVYCDYVGFAVEKQSLSDKLLTTERTFLLEAYVPEEAQEEVKNAITGVTDVVYVEFSELSEEDEPPTLLKNNALIENFEGITNTYSAPNYREFDPNTVMAFFYSLFMGFIIGDGGYGILMILGGGFLWYKNRQKPTSMSRLAAVFAVGGIFAVLWGALFNSFFGVAPLPFTVMPNPQTDQWAILGINVPSVLVISLEVGITQIFAGYMCKAVQEWRRGNVFDGICDGVSWAVFSVGVALAIVGFVDEAGMPQLGTIGGIIAGVSLLFAVVTAGRHEKLFGKFTKGFGTVYGVINYASDILSYARLYGLMLSGAVIAGLISQYGGQFVASGNIAMILLGIFLFVAGHGLNLVMNLLGAYIHDARLQYVEFYGRFFEGEGELFVPLGSSRKYISVLDE